VTSPVTLAPDPEAVIIQNPSPSLLGSVLLRGLLGLLMFGPLAFGAVEPWSIFILETGAAALFVAWALGQAVSGELQIIGNPLFSPMLVFATLIGLQLATGKTAYRAETFSSALLYFAYGLLSFLVVQCLRRTSQVKTLALVFSAYGFVLALFALVQSLSSNGKLYWLITPRFGGWIYGPYVNHNHYAGLMEMLAPIPLVILLSHNVRGARKAMAALAAAVMATTIFLSGSRGGMVAFSVQMALLATVLTRWEKIRRTALAMGAFLLIASGLMAWLGGGELAERIASIHNEAKSELSAGTRLNIDRDALRMFVRKPVLGWGLGAFPEVYPQFRTFYTNLSVDRVHNDYLQLLVETGALGFATMAWFLAVLYRSAIKKLKHPDANATITLAALLGVTGILAHSFVDFNLQIPANAALFYVLCVIAAMEPRLGLHHRSRRYSLEGLSGLSRRLEKPAMASRG
jgi:O-antigen ligase